METAAPDTRKYKILGRDGERQRVDGNDHQPGAIVEMTAEAAEFYLREGRIEAVTEPKSARTVAPKSDG
jgi:hypothetical protein